MLKMFSTQMTGIYKKIIENEEFSLEDGARLLAQSVISEGKLYIYGFKEMRGIVDEALYGAEPLPNAEPFDPEKMLPTLDSSDRVLLFTRFANDPEAIVLGKQLRDSGIPFVAVSAVHKDEENALQEVADVHIDTKLTKALLPDDDGNRFGFPSLMAALFVYYGLKFNLDEITKEYNE